MSNKKYKLIKWYPSLPKAMLVGSIMHKNEKLCNYSNLQHNFIALSLDEVENNPEFWEEIIEKPIFITEDGVCVFKPGNFFIVDIDTTQDGGNYLCWIVEKLFIKDKGCLPISSCVKIFSTEKAAKDWIDLNKPKYSLKNIENAVISFGYGPFAFSDLVKELNK